MKTNRLLCGLLLIGSLTACTSSKKVQNEENNKEYELAQWNDYNVGNIMFEDKAPQTKGSDIYRRIIPDPASYIREQAKVVLSTLYSSPEDSIPPVHTIHYTLEDIEGVSAKSGGNGYVSIFYSTRHIEQSFGQDDTAKVLFETRGVLLHELTHAYQLEPQGVGSYGDSPTFRAFIEGQGLTFLPISAATRQGLDGLPGLVYERLKELPPVQVYEPEFVRSETPADPRAFTVEQEAEHVWRVDAPWLERILEGSDVEDYESLQYFQRQLGESGVLDELVRRGVQEDDTIKIGEFEFDYVF